MSPRYAWEGGKGRGASSAGLEVSGARFFFSGKGRPAISFEFKPSFAVCISEHLAVFSSSRAAAHKIPDALTVVADSCAEAAAPPPPVRFSGGASRGGQDGTVGLSPGSETATDSRALSLAPHHVAAAASPVASPSPRRPPPLVRGVPDSVSRDPALLAAMRVLPESYNFEARFGPVDGERGRGGDGRGKDTDAVRWRCR